MHGSYSGHSRGSIARSQCGSRNALFFSAPTKEMCMTCRIEDAMELLEKAGACMLRALLTRFCVPGSSHLMHGQQLVSQLQNRHAATRIVYCFC
jgi:CO dehydrogenase/acetyl-CoA synthase alpha subunit